ncbi:hypothetical protein [Spirosoma linguale]|uniref:Uncharacterized protein n=1 Tax=Spirosoma linguale (strain ATCC 33905 / DSM 74 / LMG 10896 / Claus 1) TaxID=504472 RepID=D2QFK3_SPILD|nr:hypothetical protein Slin_2356 [Spirosoma linguale DSM 74]
MKRNRIVQICLIVCSLLAPVIQAKPDSNLAGYESAVTMNGHPIPYDALPMYSRGVLAFVEGNPRSSKHKPMLFQVMLRRAGKTVQHWPDKRLKGVYSVQLDEIWPTVQLGDELVVEPVHNAGDVYKPGKRIFKLGIINLFTWNKC